MHHLPWDEAVKSLRFDKVLSPHLTVTDLTNAFEGQDNAVIRPSSPLVKDFLDINLPKQVGSTFEVPIFFFSGRHDYQTPVTLSEQWFGEIEAPYKELIYFEESAHFATKEEPGKVLMALVNKVLPFAQAEK